MVNQLILFINPNKGNPLKMSYEETLTCGRTSGKRWKLGILYRSFKQNKQNNHVSKNLHFIIQGVPRNMTIASRL